MHAALTQLAEQDPLIGYRPEAVSVSLSGEVQTEVLEATLAEEHGLPVAVTASRTICVERVVGTGWAPARIPTTGTHASGRCSGSGEGQSLDLEHG